MSNTKFEKNNIDNISVNNYPFESKNIDNIFCPKFNLSKENKFDYFTPPGFSLDSSSIVYPTNKNEKWII